ncbi:hypothetical protein AMS68_004424 [Peltaster fructicola]|uniref:protein-tyrosine-phosphatase n=1 Tax=Peltaster fructicola TaxID=286661 RepID=A0A6H0XVW9_9PEZI|nr:hypothetical protein AMS68_004424 [Peltaster fructicola]
MGHNLFPSFGPTFDFKTMSMQQHKPQPPMKDYFNARPARGSSPTSSLTADLDANFHIDKSPMLATPRRALFTANIFKATNNGVPMATPPAEREVNATPKFASSSPAVDMMDVSPLPHKPPFLQVTLPSPTPEATPEESILSPQLLSPDIVAAPQPFPIPERKRPVTRPSLTRAKGWSTSSINQRPASATTELPPFRFGNVATLTSSTPSLMNGFTESPVEMSPPNAITVSSARRPSVGTASRVAGSPCSGHIRKPSGSRPFSRPPRKQMRRSLSMFQHPDDVMKEEQESYNVQPSLMSMVEVETEYTLKLPHFIPDGEPDSLPRITQDTMVDILEQKHAHQYSNVLVIDCRFEYEYKGATSRTPSTSTTSSFSRTSFCPPSSAGHSCGVPLRILCAPSTLTAKFIRNHDRKVNATNYPNLTYPEMYILDGGYSRFFAECRSKCQPPAYVEMNDERHEQACERGMAMVKQNHRQKLVRHQTYAYGQNFDAMDCSPTQNGRAMAQRSRSTFDIGPDLAAGIGETFQRRMASY